MNELRSPALWGAKHGSHQPVQGSTVAADGAFKFKAFPLRHDGHAVVADIATQNDLVARPRAVCRDVHAALNHADAGRGNEYLIALAAIHHLGVAGHKLYPACAAASTHRFHHPPQIVDGQAFFENESGREIERPGAAHGQIVHRAVYRQSPNVAARKKDRRNHKGVSSKRQASPANAKHRLVIELV